MSCILRVVLIIYVFVEIRSDSPHQYNISQDSAERTEINEIVDTVSKEYIDRIIEGTREHNSNNVSSEMKNSTLKVNITVNIRDCEDTGNSREARCRSSIVNYPFSASIQKRNVHYATGALISRQHVLTVAEDFFKVRETIKLYKVRLGSIDYKKGGIVLPIKRIEIHPSFITGDPNFDIALLKLSSPVTLTEDIMPIRLSRIQGEVAKAKFVTTYWPRLIVDGEFLPETAKERLKYRSMRVSTQKVIPWETCTDRIKAREAVLDETSFCLKPIGILHSICMPDVGAPVVGEDGLWGITSGWISEDCIKTPSPTIITRTSYYLLKDWLKSVL